MIALHLYLLSVVVAMGVVAGTDEKEQSFAAKFFFVLLAPFSIGFTLGHIAWKSDNKDKN